MRCLSKDVSVCAGPLDVDRLSAAANGYQRELRRKALASARPIYLRKARDYVHAIERAWKTARHRSRGRDAQPRVAA
jgi:hypothetical protein